MPVSGEFDFEDNIIHHLETFTVHGRSRTSQNEVDDRPSFNGESSGSRTVSVPHFRLVCMQCMHVYIHSNILSIFMCVSLILYTVV